MTLGMTDREEPLIDIVVGEDTPSLLRSGGERSWLGIQFDCCGVYARIYRNRERTAYEGHCPRCLGRLRVLIGHQGTIARFFRAT